MARPPRLSPRCPLPECGSNRMPGDGTSKRPPGRSLLRLPDAAPWLMPPVSAARRRPGARPCYVSRRRFAERHRPDFRGQRAGGQPVGLRVGPAALPRMLRRGEKRTARVAGSQPAAVIACDEPGIYRQSRRRGKRRDLWVWTAAVVEPDGSQWADFEIGYRSEATFLRLYERLPETGLFRTDGCRVYGGAAFGSSSGRQGGAVNWNEGLHSWCRGKLNRLHRRTKGYTKSVAMLAYSLALLLVG